MVIKYLNFYKNNIEKAVTIEKAVVNYLGRNNHGFESPISEKELLMILRHLDKTED